MKSLAHSIGIACLAVASFLLVVIGAVTAGWVAQWPLLAALGVFGLVAAQLLAQRLAVSSIVVGAVTSLRFGLVLLSILLLIARTVSYIGSGAAGYEFASFALTTLVALAMLLLPELRRIWQRNAAA